MHFSSNLTRLALLGVFVCSFLLGIESHALVELKATYGLLLTNPEKLNDTLTNSQINAPKVGTLAGLGIDGLLTLPILPIGFGVRYESASVEHSTSNSPLFGNSEYKYETGFTRISLLLNYRLINTLIYLGPIVSVGLSDSAYYKEKAGNDGNYKSSKKTSYSVGLEGGMKLTIFLLGAELGYLAADYGTPKDGNSYFENPNNEKLPLDFSGPYAKVTAGIGF